MVMTTTRTVQRVLNQNASHIISHHASLRLQYQLRSLCIAAISPGEGLKQRLNTFCGSGDTSPHLTGTATRPSIVFKTLNQRLSLSRPSLSGLEQLNLKKKENGEHLKAKCRLRLHQRNQAKGNATTPCFSPLHILLIFKKVVDAQCIF